MLILEMWHNFIILITFPLYLFDQGDVHESSILFKSEKLKVKVKLLNFFDIELFIQLKTTFSVPIKISK